MRDLTNAEQAGLAAADHLIEYGTPVFRAKPDLGPDGDWKPDGGHSGTGYWLPEGWQNTKPDKAVLDAWQRGDALCAVMGYVVDGLDVDPHKGGDLSALNGTQPTSYGRQSTPSGGTHDLIASLGVHSRDGVLSGVDLKAGVDGQGLGFLFIAPTVKRSKVTGEIGAYAWLVMPDLSTVAILGDDGSGVALAALARATARAGSEPAYDGPEYADLTAEQKAHADQYVEALIFDWSVTLAEAAEWEDKRTDHKGRGWEGLAKDAAWSLMCTALSPWTNLDLDEAAAEYERILPEVIAANEECAGKWTDGRIALAEAASVWLPPWQDPVFDATPTLRHIRAAAHARMQSAPALLACTLVRLAAEVPRDTMLPEVIGTRAPLNVGVAVVGGSSDGKTTVWELSREVLGLVGEEQKSIEKVPGSGEGLIDTWLGPPEFNFALGVKVRPLIADPRRLFYVDEIGQLGAVKDGRSGSTVGPVLRSMLSGGMLGTENATVDRRRHVPSGSYRAALVVGVHPTASDVLLNDHDASVGTPQRFFWVGLVDPTTPDADIGWPGDLDWQPPSPWPATIEYPDRIKAEIRRIARARRRGEDVGGDGLDGHARLTRLKVAALLAVLHGETVITEAWWEMAGVIALDWTREAIAICRTSLGEVGARRNKASGQASGQRQVAEAEYVERDATRKAAVSRQVLERLAKAGSDGLTWTDLRHPFRRTRDVFDRLLGTPDEPGPLVRTGQVRLEVVTVRGQDAVRVFPGGEA